MILIADLLDIARAKLEDAQVLLRNRRRDGAAYVCGYAVELALKARICRTLNWSGFPETRGEFENFASFKTHKLDVLLRLTGHEDRIKTQHLAQWSQIVDWSPEWRYDPVGQVSRADAILMFTAARRLLEVI
ncbi:MAG: hypothetical protein QOH21_1691 [Acidobacteriota bacterium]|nr:hypothetical protein [Acidobacteriota bacterium]